MKENVDPQGKKKRKKNVNNRVQQCRHGSRNCKGALRIVDYMLDVCTVLHSSVACVTICSLVKVGPYDAFTPETARDSHDTSNGVLFKYAIIWAGRNLNL